VVLKSLGLAALMAKAGIPVPTSRGSSPRVDFFETVSPSLLWVRHQRFMHDISGKVLTAH
jgi:hypothetical protein